MQGPMTTHQALAARIDAYLGKMLALWASHGWDTPRGGYHERLRPDHRPVAGEFRRLTACARQLFVYSKAARCGLMDDARANADRAFGYLSQRFRDPLHGGFVFTVDLDGAALDRSKDLYGLAFALLGLAEFVAATRDHQARDLLAQTDDAITHHLFLPEGWYAPHAVPDWSIDNRRLLQNPHMHLLEAYLAASAATGERIYQERVHGLIGIMRSWLVERQSGTIIEYRDAQGQPDGTLGHVVEPGHQFEWYWLLHQVAPMLDAADRAAATRLFDWALTHGVDKEFDGVYDQVSVDGTVIADTKRIWPLTEMIKACAVRFTDTRSAADQAAVRRAVELLFKAYLLPHGGWRERLRRDLSCYDDTLPATTSYHILLGLLEARVALLSEANRDTR
jgi:mannose/cellobiose epimerase-like protein (N-acyl-D-glucosamine 2-epimerase family)